MTESANEIVILSLVASGVNSIFEPDINSNVSVLASAAIVVEPTLTLLKAF